MILLLSLSSIWSQTDSLSKEEQVDKLDVKRVRIKRTFAVGGVKTFGYELDTNRLREVPAAQGDPIRALAGIAGVTQASDYSARVRIRGGDEEETQYWVDGVPILQAFHFSSFYSIFHMEMIRSVEVYRSGVPVSSPGGLSGGVELHSRESNLDTLTGMFDFSMFRGSAWLDVPIIPKKLGVQLAWQELWYDYLVKGGMEFSKLWASEENTANIDFYKETFDLPNFRDLQSKITYKVNSKLSLNYQLLWGEDQFGIKDTMSTLYENGIEISPWAYDAIASGRKVSSEKKWVKTGYVDMPIWVHMLGVNYKANDHWNWYGNLSYQNVKWKLTNEKTYSWESVETENGFVSDQKVEQISDNKYELHSQQLLAKVKGTFELNTKNQFEFGLSSQWNMWKYKVKVPRIVYDLITYGVIDFADQLSRQYPAGKTWGQNFEDGMDLGSAVESAFQLELLGTVEKWSQMSYLKWVNKLSMKEQLTLGSQFWVDNNGHFAVLPRLRYERQFAKGVFEVAIGNYQMIEADLAQTFYSENLTPEKAWHFDLSWLGAVSDWAKWQVTPYGRLYHNLIEETWVSKTTSNDFLYESGGYDPEFTNDGYGYGFGLEGSFNYSASKTWEGEIQGEWSKHYRSHKDIIYDFNLQRDWKFSWGHRYSYNEDSQIGFRWSYSAGTPYTEITDFNKFSVKVEGTPLAVIGKRNAKRYSPQSRLDLQWQLESDLFGKEMTYYFEVWNMFNEPNHLLLDSDKKTLEGSDLNYPIPIFFWGFRSRF